MKPAQEADALFQRGRAFLEQGSYAQALPCFLAALAAKREHAGALNGIGVCIIESGVELDKAVAYFRRAVKADPGYHHARRNMLVALLKLDKTRDAVREYRELLRLVPDDGGLRLEFARLLAGQGWKEEAFQQLRQALSRGRLDAGIREGCLEALDGLGLPAAQALAAQKRAAKPKPRPWLRRALLAGAGLGLLLAAAAAWRQGLPAESDATQLLCREFAPGTPTQGLLERARELKVARLGLFEPDGRSVIDSDLPEFSARDWALVSARLQESRGRAIFGAPPSITVNRWCTVEFAEGRVTGSRARSHAL